ncbi:MAG: hypothetical protein OXS33_11015 [bacterium]|nr:hypothetical protein [bacterium]MDE0500718.1 hypothetical protein [bacterium]
MMGLRFPERLLRVLVAISLLLGITMAGCADDPTSSGSGTAVTASYPSGYAEPVETVTALLAALAADRWEEAARLSVKGQMALMALAEGADLETVSDYLRFGEVGVGINFWAGFVQVSDQFPVGSVENLTLITEQRYEAGGVSFADFGVVSSSSPEGRVFEITTAQGDDELWRVDVIATFVDVLAFRLSETAEITRATRTEDAAVVSAELLRHVPSLEAVLIDPDLSPELRQGVDSALAAIQ